MLDHASTECPLGISPKRECKNAKEYISYLSKSQATFPYFYQSALFLNMNLLFFYAPYCISPVL